MLHCSRLHLHIASTLCNTLGEHHVELEPLILKLPPTRAPRNPTTTPVPVELLVEQH
ncbi:MAG: hypothetical protein QW224_02960 [Desulfurococcaceae archaeon]